MRRTGGPPEELRVGVVVSTIDGIEIAGALDQAWTLLRAKPGTTLALGLARGATVRIVLAAP